MLSTKGQIGIGQLKAEIARRICARLVLPHYRIFIFGSRAAGNADARSDIDIGIESPDGIPPHVLNDIRADLDSLPLLQKIEVVDFSTAAQDFKEIALKNIEVLYER